MDKILILTDIHMRSAGQTIIDLDPHAQFEKALAHATKHHADAAHMIILGDLTHSGKVHEFERVKALLDTVEIPFTLMLGNHDNREHFAQVFPDHPTTPQGHVQDFIDVGDTRLITLDTLFGPPFLNYYHLGNLCPDRLKWLDETLQNSTDKRVVIFTHHPPVSIGLPGLDTIGLEEKDAFFQTLKPYPNVAHIISGHVHRTTSGSVHGIPYSTLKSTCHQTPLILDRIDHSSSTPEPAAYGILLFSDVATILHTEDFELVLDDLPDSHDALPEGN